MSLAHSFPFLNSVAMGDKKADLILKNCNLLSVYSREIIPKIQIAISKDRIAYVGPDANHTIGPKTIIIDVKDKYVSLVLPILICTLISLCCPQNLEKNPFFVVLLLFFSDPIDIVSVAGYKGFKEFLKLGEDLPIRIFQVVPGGLPVDAKFSNSKFLSLSQEKTAIKHPHVLGFGRGILLDQSNPS